MSWQTKGTLSRFRPRGHFTKKRRHSAKVNDDETHGLSEASTYLTQSDPLLVLADRHWAVPSQQHTLNIEVVENVYKQHLWATRFSPAKTQALEFSQYLEHYLWPHFTPDQTSVAYIMSIAIMVNEKFRERIPAWQVFKTRPDHFAAYFNLVMDAMISDEAQHVSAINDGGNYSLLEKSFLLLFFINCFNSLEEDLVREQVQRLCSLPMWICLLPSRREQELKANTKWKKYWTALEKRDSKADADAIKRSQKDRRFLCNLIDKFFTILEGIPIKGKVNRQAVQFCERFLEFITDIEAQLPTRRFFNTLLDNCHFMVKCKMSNLARRKPEGHLFNQLLERVGFYAGFEINDHTGMALTEHQMLDQHYSKITTLQKACFNLFPELRQFAMSHVAGIDRQQSLLKYLTPLSNETLHELAAYLNLVPKRQQEVEGDEEVIDNSLLVELLVYHCQRRASQLDKINDMPLYPTEKVIWDENVVPTEYYSWEGCLALPKLNLQFLTLHDYLLRNLTLFQLESTYEIRLDIEDAITRLKPWVTPEGNNEFAGWARMAHPITNFAVVEVAKPYLGENRPSRVRADITLTLDVPEHVKQEWEALRKHDVCLLMAIRPKMSLEENFNTSQNFAEQVGILCVRGCEVEGMLDEEGKVIEDGPEMKPILQGNQRTWRVWLDTNQYQQDMEAIVQGAEDIYEQLNVFMRRKPKENNFKAVLETIRSLMNTDCVVPDWLHDIFLGYGNPAAAHYAQIPDQIQSMDWVDTFVSYQHLVDSFPEYSVTCTVDDSDRQVPPFRLTFSDQLRSNKRRHPDEEGGSPIPSKNISVEPYTIPNRGPYPYNQPRRNAVPFTPTQIEAIRSGMQRGLTLVVGPPGSGKTDMAVQIISNLYHNFPDQRTLLVTHSNQALNQLFEKIMSLDIDERHLLRLGHGTEELETEKDFSRYGRVNFILALRLELLGEVKRLQNTLGVSGDVAYTCETAGHFYLYQVLSRWEAYMSKVKPLADTPDGVAALQEHFPFTKYFENAPQPLFKGQSWAEDLDIAEGCFRHIKKIFSQLEEFRAFELLRSSMDRVNYLLVKEAKIIAMTCTHAALRRKDFVELSFKYDNVVMEEAAQILEVETFIPLMLQNTEDGVSRLKRVILIGDHHQLPPVIKNMAFQKYSNMEQSMFTRFVRLGVPAVQLDAQGRARPSLCELYRWHYNKLGNLPHVLQSHEYQTANPGFQFDCQLINIEDYNGTGETQPNPYFYQNLAEAEFAVGLFMYMRLQGYSPDKITILTTYNGQKHLIRDVLNKRCGPNPYFGNPEKVTTVDRYQGSQNDYVILSLVRTRHVGHLRDVRRLIVAMSRARLGLYVLARVSLFSKCRELTPAFTLLKRNPLQLCLIPNEFYPPTRPVGVVPNTPPLVIQSMMHLTKLVYDEYQVRLQAMRTRQQIPPAPEQIIVDDDHSNISDQQDQQANQDQQTDQQMDQDQQQDGHSSDTVIED
ncbi:RNA helicase aquarius-like [Dysidea avara]|uniref:RNA helicase aquarius-like n=1 Tax=Dysidea avara TaxID=196820 RepID=UPI00331C8113